jgi:hypothetical protein
MQRNESARPETCEYGADGIDLTLICWMLSLTPAERLLGAAAVRQFG